MSGVEKRDFEKITHPEKSIDREKRIPDSFVSELQLHKKEVDSYQRGRHLEDLLDESSENCLPGLKEEIDKLPEDKPAKVLDLGCGRGIAVKELQDKYPNWEIHGIDLFPIKWKEVSKDEIIQGEASHLP